MVVHETGRAYITDSSAVLSRTASPICPGQPCSTNGFDSGSPSCHPRLINRCVVIASDAWPRRLTARTVRLVLSKNL